MDKDTLIKIGNLLIKMLTPIVDAEREKAAEARARADAAEAKFRRTHCQLCYERRGELDLEVAHGVVCARCLGRCTRALLERRAKLQSQHQDVDILIAGLSSLLRDECPPADEIRREAPPTERPTFGDIVDSFDERKAPEPTAAMAFSDLCESMTMAGPPSSKPQRDLTVDRAVAFGMGHVQATSERLDAVERLLRASERLVREKA